MRKVAKVKRKLQAKFCVKEHWLHHGMNMQQTSEIMTCFVFRKQKSAVCTTQLDLKNLDGMQYTQHFSFHMDYINTYRWDPLLSWLPIFQHTLPNALVHHFCWFNSHSCNVCFLQGEHIDQGLTNLNLLDSGLFALKTASEFIQHERWFLEKRLKNLFEKFICSTLVDMCLSLYIFGLSPQDLTLYFWVWQTHTFCLFRFFYGSSPLFKIEHPHDNTSMDRSLLS